MTLSPVTTVSGKRIVEREISIQSFRTAATRMVTAPVLPIANNVDKFKARAQSEFEKNIQKFNRIPSNSILDISRKHQGILKNRKLHMIVENK